MENEKDKILKAELGDKLKNDVLLRDLTTIGVGGLTDYYLEADNIEQLVEAVNVAHKNNISILVIGWGSNIIASDYGFDGLIIKNKSTNLVFSEEKGQVIADSGISLGKLLNLAASNDLGGLEFLSGVPGTLGGAINNNAGSKDYSIGDFVKSITVLEEKGGKLEVTRHNNKWMEFEYRRSKLKAGYKSGEFKPVILTARIQLTHKRKDEILKSIQKNLEEKKANQPLVEKSAGSFFKNPGKIKEQAAGYLLDKSGAKKLSEGDAQVSKKHANFIINRNKATAKEIRLLADKMRNEVKKEYNQELEEEVEYIGKW